MIAIAHHENASVLKAYEIASDMDGDTMSLTAPDGRSLDELCRAAGGMVTKACLVESDGEDHVVEVSGDEENFDLQRHEFADGSAIIVDVANGSWGVASYEDRPWDYDDG